MTDTNLTAGPTVYEAWASEDYLSWSGGRIYADQATAQRQAALDYTAFLAVDGDVPGELSWQDCDGHWKLLDGGFPAEVYIDERFIWSAGPERALTIDEAVTS